MKTLLIIGILFVGVSERAVSMGHPHNVFAARKQMQNKTSASVIKPKVATTACWHFVCADKSTFGKQLMAALSKARSAQ